MTAMIHRVYGLTNPPFVFPTADEAFRYLNHDQMTFLMLLLKMGAESPVIDLNLLLLESTSHHTHEDILRMIDMLGHIVITNGAPLGAPTLEVFPLVRVVSWVERQSDGVVESVRMAVPQLVLT